VSQFLAAGEPGSRRSGARALSERYRSGGKSDETLDLAAYLIARLPATAAATETVLVELKRLRPSFNPRSILDAGAGPGTASWMALEIWPEIDSITMIDTHQGFLQTARTLAYQSGIPAFLSAKFQLADLCHMTGGNTYDLVIATYALAELPARRLPVAVDSLWKSAADKLVLIEPGTPDGFERLRAARTQLIAKGAHMVAPCPHQHSCPITSPDWCHFAVRLPRSRAHMHAKRAQVPFEDEKFSYLVASRIAGPLPQSRILRPPNNGKAGIKLNLCAASGLVDAIIARRDGSAYQRARKLRWGDSYD